MHLASSGHLTKSVYGHLSTSCEHADVCDTITYALPGAGRLLTYGVDPYSGLEDPGDFRGYSVYSGTFDKTYAVPAGLREFNIAVFSYDLVTLQVYVDGVAATLYTGSYFSSEKGYTILLPDGAVSMRVVVTPSTELVEWGIRFTCCMSYYSNRLILSGSNTTKSGTITIPSLPSGERTPETKFTLIVRSWNGETKVSVAPISGPGAAQTATFSGYATLNLTLSWSTTYLISATKVSGTFLIDPVYFMGVYIFRVF